MVDQYAQMALGVYKFAEDENAPNDPKGWTNITRLYPNLKVIIDAAEYSGFAAKVYQNALTGEVVVAYRGTDVPVPDFFFGNVPMGLGVSNAQVNAATRLAAAAIEQFGAANIKFAGHSLGANLAVKVAIKAECKREVMDWLHFDSRRRSHLNLDYISSIQSEANGPTALPQQVA